MHHNTLPRLLPLLAPAMLLHAATAEAQLAPSGQHYAGSLSVTESGAVDTGGHFSQSVPLDLPDARGSAPVPVSLVYVGEAFGAAGRGWDIPLSYVYEDQTTAHRRPAPNSSIGRDQLRLVLGGRSIRLVPAPDGWLGQDDPTISVRPQGAGWVMYDGEGRTYVFTAQGTDLGAQKLWHLTEIKGSDGSDVVLHYNATPYVGSSTGTPQLYASTAYPKLVLDLAEVDYNPHPTTANCFKNKVSFGFEPDDASIPPQATSLVGNAVLVRTHKVTSITASAITTCAGTWTTLRNYGLNYAVDLDLQDPKHFPYGSRLHSVTLFGRADRPSTHLSPVAFGYGTATVDDGQGGRALQYNAVNSIPWLGTGEPIGSAWRKGNGSENPWDTLVLTMDFTGDGRPDHVQRSHDPDGWHNLTWLNLASPSAPATFNGSVVLFGSTDLPFTCTGTPGGGCEIDRRAFSRSDFENGRFGGSPVNSELVWREVIDFNGDGRPDIVDAHEEQGRWAIYLNTPNPTGPGQLILWRRVSLDVSAVRSALAAKNHNFLDRGYLPLSVRTTGYQTRQGHCYEIDTSGHRSEIPAYPVPSGTPGFDLPGCIGVTPLAIVSGVSAEVTWTEWELRDLNGDGYPDVVFNGAPVSYNSNKTVDTPIFNLPAILWETTGSSISMDGTPLAIYNSTGNWLFDGGALDVSAPLYTGSVESGNGGTALGWDYGQVVPGFGNTHYAPNQIGVLQNPDFIQVESYRCGVGLWITTPDSADPNLHGTHTTQICGFADVNGDGLADRVENNSAYVQSPGGAFGVEYFPLPIDFSRVRVNRDGDCQGATTYNVAQDAGLIDVNGDGILDAVSANASGGRVWLGDGHGFHVATAGLAMLGLPAGFSLSQTLEDCSTPQQFSDATQGTYDLDGDGRADFVVRNGNQLQVYQLFGSGNPADPAPLPGAPEAGRLNTIDNGYGAKTRVAYRSAKTDTVSGSPRNVPVPEIVVSRVDTVDGANALLSVPTQYAYGQPEMVFDAVSDGWRFSGYRRTVQLSDVATITDTYGLAPFTINTAYDVVKPEWLRNQVVGRRSSVLTLAGNVGTDPWVLLGAQESDGRTIGAVKYTYDGRIPTSVYLTTPFAPVECHNLAYPYDYNASRGAETGVIGGDVYNPCLASGFVFTASTSSWRGTAAPFVSSANVSTLTTVQDVDAYGNPFTVQLSGDTSRSDDDMCVVTRYATPTGTNDRILTAPSSRVTYAGPCSQQTTWLSAETYEYDCASGSTCPVGYSSSGTIGKGFITGRTQWMSEFGDVRVADITNDSFGNPLTVTTARANGSSSPGTRTLTMTYDPQFFGMIMTSVKVTTSNASIPTMTSTFTPDPVTLEVTSKTDPNGNTAGVNYDGLGRVTSTTITPAGGNVDGAGMLSCTTYTGFDTGGPRTVQQNVFTDPVSACGAAGRLSTTMLDALGRATETDVSLGADYAATPTLITGRRVYDMLGRVAFEADPYTSDQDANSAYGTTYLFNPDRTLLCSVKGHGQLQATPAVLGTNESTEIYPTCVSHSFVNHTETVMTQDAASLLSNSNQSGVQEISYLTATGRTLERFTTQGGVTLEDVLYGYDAAGNVASMARYNTSTATTAQTSMVFNSRGQVIQLTEQGSLPQYRGYDNWGALTNIQWTDPSLTSYGHRRVFYFYDLLGRLIEKSTQDMDDATGFAQEDAESRAFYFYDAPYQSNTIPGQNPMLQGNLLGRLSHAWSGAVPDTTTTILGYDAYGRTNARETCADGLRNASRVGCEIEKQRFHADESLDVTYLYLDDNNFKYEQVNYTYDSAGRPKSAQFSDDTTSQSLFSATSTDGFGRIRQAQYGATTYTANYAEVGRRLVTDVTVSSPLAASAGGGTREISLQPAAGAPAFDPVGRERSRQEIKNGDTSSPFTVRSYDALGRLSQSQGDGHTVLLDYDSLGNLLFQHYDDPATSVNIQYDRPSHHVNDGLTADPDRLCQAHYGNGGGETVAQACARVGAACGFVIDNCNHTVLCPNTCAAGTACGGAGAGPNACGAPDDSFDIWAQDPAQGEQALAGDFNGDGKSDIALVLRGGTIGGWASTPVAFSHGDGSFSVVNWIGNAFASYVASPGTQVVAGDVDGDGRTDLIAAGGSGWGQYSTPVAFSNGDGTFRVTNLGSPTGDFPSSWGASVQKVLAGDVNGDHRADLIFLGNPSSTSVNWSGIVVGFSNGDGSFSSYPIWMSNSGRQVPDLLIPFAAWASLPAVQATTADFNSDGLADIVLGGGVNWGSMPMALSNGDGTFKLANPVVGLIPSWMQTYSPTLFAGDMNGDKQADLLLAHGSMSTFPVALVNPGTTGPAVGGNITGFGSACLDVSGGQTANGTQVQTWTCNNTSAQQWTINSDQTIHALGKCLDVSGAGTADGTKVQLWDCNGSVAQKWVKTGITYVNPNSNKCLTANGSTPGNGVPMVIQTCSPPFGSAQQQFRVWPHSDFPSFTVMNNTASPLSDFWLQGAGVQGVVGDFDGDGRMDVAGVGYGYAGWFTVPIGFSNGDGTFRITNLALPALTPAGKNAPTGGAPASADTGPCTVQYDGLGAITHMPTANGTRDMTYRSDGLLRTITNSQGASAHFYYDPFGEVSELRVTSSSGDARHEYHLGGSLLFRDDPTSPTLTRTIALPGGRSATRRGPNGTWVFRLGDQQGTRFSVDQNGVFVQETHYTPYGQPTSTGPDSQPGSQLYSSLQWNDGDLLADFGVSQLGARIYDPTVGRFLSRDPLLVPRTGATSNPYAFAMNDPVNFSDPTGLDVYGALEQGRTEYDTPGYGQAFTQALADAATVSASIDFGRALGDLEYDGHSNDRLYNILRDSAAGAGFDGNVVARYANYQFKYREMKDHEPLWVQLYAGGYTFDGFVATRAENFHYSLAGHAWTGLQNGLLVADGLSLAEGGLALLSRGAGGSVRLAKQWLRGGIPRACVGGAGPCVPNTVNSIRQTLGLKPVAVRQAAVTTGESAEAAAAAARADAVALAQGEGGLKLSGATTRLARSSDGLLDADYFVITGGSTGQHALHVIVRNGAGTIVDGASRSPLVAGSFDRGTLFYRVLGGD